MTESDFDKCFNVNVKGVYFGTSAVLPSMVQRGQGGSIINIASVGATRPRPGLVWYNSSKGAVWNVGTGNEAFVVEELIDIRRRQRGLQLSSGHIKYESIPSVLC